MIERGTAVVLAIVATVGGCKGTSATTAPATGSGSGSGSGSAPAPIAIDAAPTAPPAPAWTLETAPVEIDCEGTPLELGKPKAAKPVPDRTLEHGSGINVCQGLADVAAVCTCLAASAGKWAADTLTPPAACEVATVDGFPAGGNAALVEVSTQPSEGSTKFDGTAYVLVARRGTTWSAVDTVDREGDIDHDVTPKRSATVKIDRVTAEPDAGGSVYVIESRAWTREHDLGETEASGGAQVTICRVPSAAAAAPFCYAPLALADWAFTHDDGTDKCTVVSGDLYAATITATSATERLVGGKDEGGAAGRYRLQAN